MASLAHLHFAEPRVLLMLMPLALLLGVVAFARLRTVPAGKRVTIILLRGTILTLLVLGLAEPVRVQPSPSRTVVFAVDVSDSVSQAQQDWARDWVRQATTQLGRDSRSILVEFGEHAQVTSLDAHAQPKPPGKLTNLEDALQLADSLSSARDEGRREVVLLTDGWENAGSAHTAVVPAADGGATAFSWVPIDRGTSRSPEVVAVSVEAPPIIRAGDIVDLAVVVDSTEPMGADLRVALDGEPIETDTVTLETGANRLLIGARVPASGFHSLRVEVVPHRDTNAANNALEAITVAREAGRVVVFENLPGEGTTLARELAEDGLQVETRPAASIPPAVESLLAFDGAVLVNTPATNLTLDQQETLKLFVHEHGRGLVVVGGPLSFGPGAYQDSLLDDILPVSSEPPDTPERGSVALFLVVDKSSSMREASTGDARRITMARAAASQAVGMLQPGDIVGVLGFDSDFSWVVPATQINAEADIDAVQGRIAAIEAGGSTSIYPALQAAYDAAAQADARLKHIVLLTDGQSRDAGYAELIEQMRPYRITLSTVAVGSGADVELLARLAEMGQGRHYFTERGSQIPAITSKEVSILSQNSVVEGDVAVHVDEPSPLLRGLPDENTDVAGYVGTTPRDEAVTALETERGDPLLAHWQYGVGRVAAWTSDISRWAGAWAPDGESAHFWPRVVRWSMPAPAQSAFRVRARVDPTGSRVVLHAESRHADGSFADLLDTRATVVLPDGTAREVPLPQVGPGSYEQALQVDEPGIYHVLFTQRDGRRILREELVGFSVPAAGAEQRTVGVNRALLARLAEVTGGRELDNPSEILSGPGEIAGQRRVPLWPWPVALAALLLPLDVALRRSW